MTALTNDFHKGAARFAVGFTCYRPPNALQLTQRTRSNLNITYEYQVSKRMTNIRHIAREGFSETHKHTLPYDTSEVRHVSEMYILWGRVKRFGGGVEGGGGSCY